MRQALGVLAQHGQSHGDVEPVEVILGTGRDPIQEAADAVAAIGQEGQALVHPQILAVQHLEQPAFWLVIMGLNQAEVAVVPNLGHRLADNDLELLPFVVPVAQVGAVDADDDWPLRYGQLLAIGRVVFNFSGAGLSIAEFGLLSKRNLVQVVANSRCIGSDIDRQHVLQQAGCQAEGHQRCPAGLEVEQLRGGMLGKQPSQRAEGLATCWLAGAAVKAWADQGNGAERSAEQKAAASFALKVPTTLLAVSMPRQETRRLGRNEAYLRTGQHALRLVKRQADLLELVIALVEAGNHLIAEHG